jgi:hypothetical protein
LEAVARRRANRAAARIARLTRQRLRGGEIHLSSARRAFDTARQAELRFKQARVAQKMIARQCGGHPPHAVRLLYAYWQFRSAGCDVLDPAIRGQADPMECASWRWWLSLHPMTRRQLRIDHRRASMGKDRSCGVTKKGWVDPVNRCWISG